MVSVFPNMVRVTTMSQTSSDFSSSLYSPLCSRGARTTRADRVPPKVTAQEQQSALLLHWTAKKAERRRQCTLQITAALFPHSPQNSFLLTDTSPKQSVPTHQILFLPTEKFLTKDQDGGLSQIHVWHEFSDTLRGKSPQFQE